jgi:hypothetical protein
LKVPAPATEWLKLLAGLVIVFLVLQGMAGALGSMRGEAGLPVGASVVLAAVAVKRFIFRWPVAMAAVKLGLGRPARRGLAAAGGLAEEVLFRGYLFRRLREGHPFRQAAMLAALPFVAVHLMLFLSLPWAVALTAVLIAVVLSFPLSHLFEMGRNTIWAPAIAHFVIQGAIKMVGAAGDSGALLPLVWMAASAGLPQLVFLLPRKPVEQG